MSTKYQFDNSRAIAGHSCPASVRNRLQPLSVAARRHSPAKTSSGSQRKSPPSAALSPALPTGSGALDLFEARATLREMLQKFDDLLERPELTEDSSPMRQVSTSHRHESTLGCERRLNLNTG